MSYHLTVRQPFGDYRRGDRITENESVTAVLADHAHHVIKTAPIAETPAPDRPE